MKFSNKLRFNSANLPKRKIGNVLFRIHALLIMLEKSIWMSIHVKNFHDFFSA